MKKPRTFRRLVQRLTKHRAATLSLESLEDRHLLAANVLATVSDSITSSSPSDDIEMTIATPDAAAGDGITLIVTMTATESSLDPNAPVVRSSSGAIMTPESSMADVMGDSGMIVVTLPAGEYTIETSAESGTTGDYRVEVSALGDVDSADSRVTAFESLRATAALMQALGTSNHVTDLFYLQNGIDMTVSQYDSGFDANMSGAVEAFEVGITESNEDAGRAMVTLQSDVTGPTIEDVRLVNDTGTRADDAISTDVRITARALDENEISQIFVSLDGGPTVDVTADLTINSGFFTLTKPILDGLAGGSLAAGSHSVVISAVDEFDNETAAPVTFDFTLIENNMAPTSSGPFTATATEDSPFSFDASSFFSDANPGDVLRFTGTGLPDWLTLSADGQLTGTPDNDDVGTDFLTVTATDSQGLSVDEAVELVTENTPDAPIINPILDQTIEEDVLFSLDLTPFISDPDPGDVFTTSADQADGVDASGNPMNLRALPSWLSFDPDTRVLSGTPTDDDVGMTVGIFVLAVDQVGLSGSDFFEITIQDINDSPMLVSPIPDDTISEGDAYSINLSDFFSDADRMDTLTFSAELADGSQLPSWLSLNATTGVLSGTPDDPDVGVTLEITATATDTFAANASDTYSLTVNNVNDAPFVNNSTLRVLPDAPDGTVVGTVDAGDEDTGDTLTFSSTGGGGNFDVDSATGVITVANGAMLVDGDEFTLNITATDLAGDSDSGTVTINVSSNAEPVANDDMGFATNDIEELSIMPSDLVSNDTDADGDTLTVASVDAMSENEATVAIVDGQVVYNPRMSTTLLALGPGDSLVDTFSYTVTDGNGGMDTATVSVMVNGTDSVIFTPRTLDVTTGAEITTVAPGQEFDLVLFVQDVRPDPQGVFAAFADVTYTAALASIAPGATIVPGDTYDTVPSGDATTTPGVIDEVGGLDGFEPLGGGEFEVFRIRMVANGAAGVIEVGTDPADDAIQHAVLVFLDDDPVANQQIVFNSTSLTIGGGAAAPLSGSVPGTNFANPLDTNHDTHVSPQDMLVVINAMRTGHADGMYPDVDANGVVSPLDALAVVNHLNGGTPQAPLSASASAVESTTIEVAMDAPVAAPVGGGASAAGSADLTSERTGSLASEAAITAWSPEHDATFAVDPDHDETTSAIDAIFSELE